MATAVRHGGVEHFVLLAADHHRARMSLGTLGQSRIFRVIVRTPELEVLELAVHGCTNETIAQRAPRATATTTFPGHNPPLDGSVSGGSQ